jgi:ankyrin repeat protein
MSQSLPPRPNLEWLKSHCKDRLRKLREHEATAKLSDVQLLVAREFGFSSWRKLKARVDERCARVEASATQSAAAISAVAADDAELAQLFAAVEAGDLQQIGALLIHRPLLATARGRDGRSALHVAAGCDDPRAGVLLLAFGAEPEAKFGQSGHTALSWAVTCNSMNFATTMVRLGWKPDLFCAAGAGSVQQVQSLFDDSGELLPGSVRTGSTRFAADGTRLPCPPQTASDQISDAFCIACRNAQEEVARFLFEKHPNLSFKGFMGATALHWAYFGGSRVVVDLVERAGADQTARDDVYHCMPRAFGICAPASWGILALVRARLRDDPSLANVMDGHTSPLHEAARSGNLEIVRLLLDCGADPGMLDGSGKTALAVAAAGGQTAVVEMLKPPDNPN